MQVATEKRINPKLRSIMEAASRLFYQSGYAGTDVRAIADDVGLHVSSLYNYISGKEQLLFLIVDECTTIGLEWFKDAIEGIDDPIEKIRAAIKAQVRFHCVHKHMALTAHQDNRMLTGEYAEAVSAMNATNTRLREGILKEAIAAGAIRDTNVTILNHGIMEMARGVARWYNPEGPESPETIGEIFADLVINGLRRE